MTNGTRTGSDAAMTSGRPDPRSVSPKSPRWGGLFSRHLDDQKVQRDRRGAARKAKDIGAGNAAKIGLACSSTHLIGLSTAIPRVSQPRLFKTDRAVRAGCSVRVQHSSSPSSPTTRRPTLLAGDKDETVGQGEAEAKEKTGKRDADVWPTTPRRRAEERRRRGRFVSANPQAKPPQCRETSEKRSNVWFGTATRSTKAGNSVHHVVAELTQKAGRRHRHGAPVFRHDERGPVGRSETASGLPPATADDRRSALENSPRGRTLQRRRQNDDAGTRSPAMPVECPTRVAAPQEVRGRTTKGP